MLFANQLTGLVSSQEMGYSVEGATITIFASRWGGVFTLMQNYLYFYIPLLTMSLVSKELSSGSIRLLYSSPITNTQIIVGKFFSMMIYGLIMIGILFLITLCSWAVVKDFELSMVLTGLLGFCLLYTSVFKAIGPGADWAISIISTNSLSFSQPFLFTTSCWMSGIIA